MGNEPKNPGDEGANDEEARSADETTIDRDAIFRRRASLIASALAGLSLSGCADTPPQPCLSAPPLTAEPTASTTAAAAETAELEPTATASATASASATTAPSTDTPKVDAGTPRPDATPKPFPHPCLTPVRPTDKR